MNFEEGKTELERAGTKEHAARIFGLATVIWTEHYTPIIGEAQVKYMLEVYHSEKNIACEIACAKAEYSILVSGGKDAGYLAVERHGSDLYLSKFYVLKSLRGRGLGRFMEGAVVQRACETGLKRIFLHVNKNNTDAIRVYEKMGYAIAGGRVKEIGGGFVMRDYVMEKLL